MKRLRQSHTKYYCKIWKFLKRVTTITRKQNSHESLKSHPKTPHENWDRMSAKHSSNGLAESIIMSQKEKKSTRKKTCRDLKDHYL